MKKDINYLPAISLNYPDNAFSAGFRALARGGKKTFRSASPVAGREEGGTDAGAHRYAAYANLPPGNYALEVRMSNRYGFWPENIHSLNVAVLPAWWQRTGVRVVAGLLFAGLVSFGVARLANQRLRRRINIENK